MIEDMARLVKSARTITVFLCSIVFAILVFAKDAHALVVAPIIAVSLIKLSLFLVGVLAVPVTAVVKFITGGSRKRTLGIAALILGVIFAASLLFLHLISSPKVRILEKITSSVEYGTANTDLYIPNTESPEQGMGAKQDLSDQLTDIPLPGTVPVSAPEGPISIEDVNEIGAPPYRPSAQTILGLGAAATGITTFLLLIPFLAIVVVANTLFAKTWSKKRIVGISLLLAFILSTLIVFVLVAVLLANSSYL